MTTSAKPSDAAQAITPGSPRYKHDMERAHDSGVVEGRNDCRYEMLSWLQERYLTTPDTSTPEAAAMLTLTRDLAEFLRSGKR